ncbi:hypothetical protein SAMN02745126_02300 [Enhydrobacter aerosaccus]|uniref:MetA-pathway of phenol degradation n=1 Tax=Enhydrobacter aerosaccus TaxID=225324 RepID=A0A1T4NIB6_9HYPH|nr:hypothetical protein [Enhydrobacter aerosaccus]SJZ78999.1 hypothetical protein SAMN02745126_02300 [Enhydrobacter aerosaccus]
MTPSNACSSYRHAGRLVVLGLVANALQFAPVDAWATDEIQVYNAEIAPVGTFTLQQHLNYVWQGSTTPDFEGGIAPFHTLNGTPELAYGVTDWYEIGFYAPFTVDATGTFIPGGVKFRHLFVSPHAEERNLFYGLNIELSYQTPRFAQSPFGIELRPILGVRENGWEAIINPIIDVSFGSEGAVDFAPAMRLARQVSGDVWVGAEYYANMGPLGNFSTIDTQQHNLFGVVDFKAFGLDVNFGVGVGLTQGSDAIVTKLILGRAF